MAISRTEARQRFSGLFTPLMTPFKENYDLDLDGLRSNVRFLMRGGFGENGSGVFLVAGAGGEFQVLTIDERKKVAQTVAGETGGKVPLIFGVQHTDTQKVIELCKFAKQVGIDGVQLSTPYYDNGQTVDDMIRFFKQINDATDIGIMVYTDHWHGHRFPSEFFSRLLDLDHVVAVKFSQPSVVEFRKTLTKFADKFAFVDNQTEHVTGNKLGEVGFLSHEAHFHLEHQLQLWNAIKRKDYTRAVELLSQLNWPFNDFSISTSINDANTTKAAIEMVGLAAGPVRPPARNLTREERAELAEILRRAGAPLREAKVVRARK